MQVAAAQRQQVQLFPAGFADIAVDLPLKVPPVFPADSQWRIRMIFVDKSRKRLLLSPQPR